MPRNHHPGASTLRNRIRITNKTRLKIHHGNLDADALLIPDEDEEKHRLTNLVAGVDAEDANEHHLQAVLSAASHRNHANANRQTRGGTDKSSQNAPPAAYIPTPDSTGIVDHYTDLYPPNRWKDPSTYLSTSTTVEESCNSALANGFTYYMDERDKDWLDKNNEEARGEGTSAQGAVSSSSSIRTSARSAKAKGKEPEASQPLVISEDEFELVMGLFEKVTHEQTEYLHHSLETGMAFPAFSEYQDTFTSPLPAPTFASYAIPSWIPPPATLLRIARTVYPFWKERRIERGGHRIIPILNGDESDTLNESYICFRRREIKAVRKTRASQVTSSDKLVRLQAELAFPLDLAKAVFMRETHKKECAHHAQQVWERRLGLVDLKRKYPSLGDRMDEELLVDKEKPKKSETIRPTKIRTESGVPRPEAAMRPRDRTALINEAIEATLNRQKDQDHHWEDQIDNPYQQPLVPYSSRLFKYIPVKFSSAESDGKPILQRPERAVRMRRGRGGRMLVDRRDATPRQVVRKKRSVLFDLENTDIKMDDGEDDERASMAAERWRYDLDDGPAVGPEGPDEQNRILVDDYESKYLRHSMTLLVDSDQQSLITDPTIPVMVDGRPQGIVPFRLGMAQPPMRRDATGVVRPILQPGLQQPGPLTLPLVSSNGTPVSVQQQLKKMPPPSAVPQMRISSNGGMRPPTAIAGMQGSNTPAPQSSPPNSAAVSQHSSPPTNGVNRAAINMPHVEPAKPEANHTPLNGAIQVQQPIPSEALQSTDLKVNGVNGSPIKQNAHHPIMSNNGYHLTPLANQAAVALANTAQYPYTGNQHGLSVQQMQNLKSAFANLPNGTDIANLHNVARSIPASYLHVPGGANFNIQQLTAGANMNLKLPASRQMQWAAGAAPKVGTVPNGIDVSASPNQGQAVPARTPSTNGTRSGMRMPNGQIAAHAMSPHIQHSPSPMAAALAQSQSPPRLPLTPTLTRASPSLQHQQPGSSKSGY